MKSFFTLILFVFLLAGCSKEATTNSRLKGKWTVDVKQSKWWTNPPQYSETSNYGTMEFDKKGNGNFIVIIPEHTVIDQYIGTYTVPEKKYEFDLKHSFEDVGEVLIMTDINNVSDTIGVNWGWDKKSFTLIPSLTNDGTITFYCHKQ
jgi:hypothetical protein